MEGVKKGLTHGRVEPDQQITNVPKKTYLECKDLGFYIEIEGSNLLVNFNIMEDLFDYYIRTWK